MQNDIPKRCYKIMPGDKVIVYRHEGNYGPSYKVMITKTKMDGTKAKFYKDIKFRKGVEVENRTLIKINQMLEDVRENPKDPYHPIYSLVILDFEVLEKPFDSFQNKENNSSIISKYNNSEDLEIDDSYFSNPENEENVETPW